MIEAEYCPACSEAVLWKCTICERENERSVHTYHPATGESTRIVSAVGALIGLVSGLYVMVPV
jgi:hypothetical protein